MRLDNIRRIPDKIGIASGEKKAVSVIGAIKGGFINILVTDAECAKRLLKYSEA